MEFLMPETKVYAILTAGYDRKERMEGRILGEEHAMAGSFFYPKNSIDFSVSFYNYHEPSIYPCL